MTTMTVLKLILFALLFVPANVNPADIASNSIIEMELDNTQNEIDYWIRQEDQIIIQIEIIEKEIEVNNVTYEDSREI